MKQMKKILAGILALTMFAAVSQAQDVKTDKEVKEKKEKKEWKHHGKRHHKGMMEQKMNFSEEQKAKLKDLRAEHKKQMAELNKQDQITVKEFRSRKENLSKKHKEDFNSILTAEQKAQIEKMKQERKEKGDRRQKSGEKRKVKSEVVK